MTTLLPELRTRTADGLIYVDVWLNDRPIAHDIGPKFESASAAQTWMESVTAAYRKWKSYHKHMMELSQ